jgi:hypothetical protein
MPYHLGPIMGLLGALAWSGLSAQQQACTLLTPADIEAITGTKEMGEPHPTDMVIPAGPQKGQTMNGCMWGVTGSGMVSVSLMQLPQGVSREAAMAKLEEVYGQLRAKKWTQEDKNYPDGRCTIFTPPPTEKSAPILSGCIVEKHGMVLSSSLMHPKVKLPMDKARALSDKVASHMH